jgi:hypothetical protein
LILAGEGAERESRAEEWLVEAGRRYRAALQASPAEQHGRALQQWGAALALRGKLLAQEAPDDAAQLFFAAAEKFAAAVALPQPPAGAHASLGSALVERACCMEPRSPARASVLRDAQLALEDALRREPDDEAAADMLAFADAELEVVLERDAMLGSR